MAVQAAAEQLGQADIQSTARDEVSGSLTKAVQAAAVPMHASQMAQLVMRQALSQALDVFCAAAESQAAVPRTPPKTSAKAAAASKKVSGHSGKWGMNRCNHQRIQSDLS